MHDRALAALEALIGLADQVLAGLREHHDRLIIYIGNNYIYNNSKKEE